ncbi:hypothetical protein [Acinetobacter seifertii]|nr:hypothetical protein [Acinetobacter seifertii]
MSFPNFYSIIYLSNKEQSINIIVVVLEDIELFYQLLNKLVIDLA